MQIPLSINAIDDFLSPDEHKAMWAFLSAPAWTFGAYSADRAGAPPYFYKHFAGFRHSGVEDLNIGAIEDELAATPLLSAAWARLKDGPLQQQRLGRCYANAMPPGIEGGVHVDSSEPTHLTAIYYPHLSWDPGLGGETLFFNPQRTDLIAAVYPKPNRVVFFSGVIPHVARPISTRAAGLRITLMFKTLGAAPTQSAQTAQTAH